MSELSLLDKLKELAANEDVLSVGKEVNELRSKFEDFTIEEERKIQVAELEAEEQKVEIEAGVVERKAEVKQMKDDFLDLLKAYNEQKKAIIEQRKATEAQNMSEKTALIKRLKEVVSSEENIGAAFGALKEIQEKWKTIGDIPRNDRNDIETEYSHLLDDFFYNIKIYKDLKDHDFHRNQQLKEALIEDLKKLHAVETVKGIDAQLKKLQNDWNDIGPVPNDKWEGLKEAYWTEVRSLYNKVNRFYEDRRAQQLVNLEKKQALVDETKAIIAEMESNDSVNTWEKDTKAIKDVQAKWKTIGFGPKKENEQIWKEFRGVCDSFFNAKKEFFGVVHEQFDAIADKKKVLIERARKLATSTEWKDTANSLKRLQQDWKNLGHSGVKHEQKLWKEFRGACDSFFNAKQDHFSAKDKENEENLVKKQTVLTALEKYKLAKEKKDALADLKQFAEDFNAIGHVPIKQKDTIYDAFKASMDKHYGALKLEGAEKEQILFEAKLETLKASPNAWRSMDGLKMDIRKDIDRQIKEIAQLENNLGFFANSKGADALKKDVEKKVNRAKDKIADLKAKLKMIPNE
ncbi:MAG: DUF349 domain-containing protein [Crocinitomicaceae bacterium]|nr:DUF349 domain-containing protein [Crocinitomicaceae bacterium]